MKTDQKILKHISENFPISGSDIARHFMISRQAVNKHLKALIEEGKIGKVGQTKSAKYLPSSKMDQWDKSITYNSIIPLQNIEEDKTFSKISAFLNLRKNVRKNVYDISHYVFTEMLNNAIDHSYSEKSKINVTLDNYDLNIFIRDFGIGLFYSLKDKFGLRDEYEAATELMKGKRTTMAERHSGEGIFFTSKAVDTASYRSHEIQLTFDNQLNDIFVREKKKMKGTEVSLKISRQSRKKLSNIFAIFAPEDYDYKFEKTKVYVKLFQRELISRSEARRLLTGLDKFREIVLDFKGVTTLGQGFTDEIFRVFQKANPHIKIVTENVSPLISSMMKHVVDK